jgi:hypothetical protein
MICCRNLSRIVSIFLLGFCHPLLAQEREWQVDSLHANSSVSKPDSQQVYEVLLKMLDRWNAHDIDAYLEVYWKSPELLVASTRSSLTAGNNSTILILMDIRIALRWVSSSPNAFRSSC